MKRLTYLKNVTTLQLDSVKCNGCATCTIVCPHAVFKMQEKKSFIQHKDFCMECGACAMNCPTNAITVKSGVGCAAGIITGLIRGTEPTCDCGPGGCC
ncbi:MAG: 4Fe-4S binding protein [Bacteroidales bacterium]|nr:4Fe-4S binding protein [Bacteroidales bacterium]